MYRNSSMLRRSFSKLLFNKSTSQQEIITNYCATFLIACTHNLAVEKPVLPKENIEPVNRFVSRTHTCGELKIKNVGENVRLNGWLEFSRMYNKFLILRDSYGSVQCIIPEDRKDLEKVTKNLTFESVLSIEGTVLKRPDGQQNKNMSTGNIEIEVESLKVLNRAKPTLPFIIRDYNKANESNQLRYRYISLRYPELQKYLRFRSKMIMSMREYLIKECGFVDIETPTLFKRTPEGAKEFVVPTRIPGQFYSLVQSPQQFKQLLMVGGFDRYFQVARCYRDETPRHDRQPEFTQLDIEMSFTDSEGIMELIENLLVYSWPEESDGILSVPFKRMKYEDAMTFYGTDQPDLRIPQKLRRLTDLVDHSLLKQNLKIEQDGEFEVYALVFSEKHDFLTNSVKQTLSKLQSMYFPSVKLVQLKIPTQSEKMTEIIRGNIESELNLEPGDVLFLACGEKILAQSLLGKVRVDFTNLVESNGAKIRSSENELLWITDFPLFSFDAETNRLQTMHHPFTKPHPDDMQYLAENPLKVRGLHYDLVMNGSEIAGGSIRIHEAKLQKEILKTLNIDESHLSHMLEALESGAPPHGGIAIGLDRLMCLLCRTESIKNVIAFPKTMSGRDLMSGAPSPISEEEKQFYHIQTVDRVDE